MQVHAHYKTTTIIDDPDTGADVEVRTCIKRLTLDEFSAFYSNYVKSANAPSDALVARQPDHPDEMARVAEGGAFVLSDVVVRERRLAAMTEDERTRFDNMDAAEEAFSRRFLADTITRFVTFEPDQVWDDSSGEKKAVVKGEDIVRIYGGRQDVLRQLLQAVMFENTMSAAQKKVLRSRSAFERSLTARQPGAAGTRPAPSAPGAEPAALPTSEGAPDRTTPSGPSTPA